MKRPTLRMIPIASNAARLERPDGSAHFVDLATGRCAPLRGPAAADAPQPQAKRP